MDRILKKYVPMTETAFYILLSLTEPRHGYGIIKQVEEMTRGRIKLGSGTIYGTLTKMQRDEIITIFADEKRKKIYEITDLGKQLMRVEMDRLKELHDNALRYEEDFQ
ncbi:PadR family transcriptional regulator [Tenuibacillus multivorans]|uniref:DNA-binding transcriptional regulator, PadR family n=1 Tax=Tenuibacillus multivorans TaxID=237069 RepID=A0A1H0BPF3_9BACI|nr:PadR family transcriptional regulator [Tenuibacillus multivorans]SDN47468.1 DNA-binding transcriptional regulator, PadR family [Tenuibacillus multivorans]